MYQSKAKIYIHIVWATHKRLPLLTQAIERAVLRCIAQEAERIGCKVLALNAMPDHVHLLVKLPTTNSVAKLANQVKGVSSHFTRDSLPGNEGFRWQNGYAAFSVGGNQVKRTIAYIANQQQHHNEGSTFADWEEPLEFVAPR